MKSPQWWRYRSVRLRIGSMAVLLILLVINVFVMPFSLAPESLVSRILRDVLLTLILLTGVAAVSDRRMQFAVITAVAAVAIVVRWLAWLVPEGAMPGVTDETALVSLGILGAVIGIKVFSGGTVTFDRILGAVALYILIGVVWAEAYELVSVRIGEAFTGMEEHATRPADHATWIYFRFVTLTTVGFGDVTPLAPAARSLAILEALIGQLYPAIVLARLVSLHAAGGGSGEAQD